MPDKNDGDLSREVFAQYGRAAYAATEMERCLVNLASLLEPAASQQTHPGREGEFSGFFRTLNGKPAASIDRLAARLGWESEPLRRAVEIRTYLRDRFWQENSDLMYYFDGKRRMVEELTRMAGELLLLNDRMAAEASRLFVRHGLTEKLIVEAMDKVVTPESRPQSRVGAKKLTACVAYRKSPGERGYIPALQCENGRLLLITREGLVEGPESPSKAQCVEFMHLADHFPTTITGTVESAGPWSWRVPLGEYMELFVERGKQEKGTAVQWGIRRRNDRGDTAPEVPG